MKDCRFRMWLLNAKKWVDPPSHCYISGNGEALHIIPGTEGFVGLDSQERTKNKGDYVDVQFFMGLKDKNGKEIWEGDIVIQKETDWDAIASRYPNDQWKNEDIDFDCPEFQIEAMRDVATMDRFPSFWLINEQFGYEGEELIDCDYCEVIGNIYDNPELLKNTNEKEEGEKETNFLLKSNTNAMRLLESIKQLESF